MSTSVCNRSPVCCEEREKGGNERDHPTWRDQRGERKTGFPGLHLHARVTSVLAAPAGRAILGFGTQRSSGQDQPCKRAVGADGGSRPLYRAWFRVSYGTSPLARGAKIDRKTPGAYAKKVTLLVLVNPSCTMRTECPSEQRAACCSRLVSSSNWLSGP